MANKIGEEIMDKYIINIENASLKFEQFSIKPAELKIPQGYIIGIQGDNGAGKTTFLRMLLGLYKNMQGSILIDNLDVIINRKEVMTRVGFVSEEHKFFMGEDAKENERMYSRFYPTWDSDEYDRMLRNLNLSAIKRLDSFSIGEMVKYQIAFAAAYRPKVLLLDEPTANLDPVFRDDFLRTLQEFVADYETTILLSTHLQEDLSKIADYIIEIEDGLYQMREVEV